MSSNNLAVNGRIRSRLGRAENYLGKIELSLVTAIDEGKPHNLDSDELHEALAAVRNALDAIRRAREHHQRRAASIRQWRQVETEQRRSARRGWHLAGTRAPR